MRFAFGRGWVYQGENDGEGGEAGGGAGGEGAAGGDGEGGAAPDGGDGTGGEGVAAAGAGGTKKEDGPKDMLTAIDAALGYKKDAEGFRLDAAGQRTHNPDGSSITDGTPEKPAAKPAAGADGKETDTHHANGKPKKNEKGEDLDDQGKALSKPAAKTSAELALKPEELKALSAKTQQRFGEMINTLKSHEGTIAKQGEQIKVLAEARDTIIGLMDEAGMKDEQFASYLEFHRMLQSNDAKELESALQMIEAQRVAIYTKLGKEPAGGGIDLLKDFPDLQRKVDESEITREDALELARGRRAEAARTRASQHQQNQQKSEAHKAAEFQQASEKALADIKAWSDGLAKSDLDYSAKESKLLDQLDGVLKEYPPNLWVPTLKRLYAGIVITKAPETVGGDKRPLRPSGAKPGGKQPATMEEAISQGLGYTKAA